MNLSNLFQMQTDLNDVIMAKRDRREMTPERQALALWVEVGEMGNEIRSFKYWSHDRKPRPERVLEEFADCLHFAICLGIEIGIDPILAVSWLEKNEGRIRNWAIETKMAEGPDVFDRTLIKLYLCIGNFFDGDMDESSAWQGLMGMLIGAGMIFGFTLEDMEKAYIKKNRINYQRQADRY